MFSEQRRLGRGVSDGSRQPPTCTTHSRKIAFHTAQLQHLISFKRILFDPFTSRHKSGAIAVHGTSGKDNQSSRRVFTEEDSDDQQSVDVGSWWQADRQTDEAGPQHGQRHHLQQNQQALPQLNRNITALAGAPRLSPFHRSLETISPIGPSTATNAPIRNRVLAAAAASGGGGSEADTTASTSHVLLPTPTAPPIPPTSSTSPHSRALGFLSTAVSVLAVGAYVYTVINRRQASGDATAGSRTIGQIPPAAPAPPVPPPPTKVIADSGLFRPANATGTAPVKAAVKTKANAAVLGSLPAPALAPAKTGVAGLAAAAAATAPRPAAVVVGPEQPTASPAREHGWWRRLARVYYISFGAQYGLVPRVRLDGTAGTLGSGAAAASAAGGGGGGGGGSGVVLAAFEDAADAEYVANSLWENLVHIGAQPSGPRPSTMGVLSAAPIFLEDLAAMRGAPVEVVPTDGLRKDVQLSTAQLEVVLAALVRGVSPEAAAAQAERVLDEAAAAAAAVEAAEADASIQSASGAALGRGGGGSVATATATSTSARGRAGTTVRNPLERTAEERGVKIRLPSKFDFPGFDAERALEPTAMPVQQRVPAAAGATVEAAAAASAAALADCPPPQSTDTSSATPLPPGGAPTAATTTTLPQVTPSAVQEPTLGVHGSDVEGDLQYDVWTPYGGGKVVDTEAVDVSATAAAMVPPPSPPVSGAVGAAATAVPSTAVPSREMDEAMREYQELETLLMMATNTRRGGAAAAAVTDRRGEFRQVAAADRRNDASSSILTAPAPSAAANLSPSVSEEGNQWLQPSQQLQSQQREEGAGAEEQGERKSRPERAAEIIAQKGPTDAALEAALAALGDVDDERTEENLFDEYFSIFNSSSSDRQEPDSTSSSSGSRNGRLQGEAGRAGSSSDLAAEVAEVQWQLAGVVQAVAAAHASGSPPPADATTTMQRLQQQLQNLQGRLAAVPPAATTLASVSSTTATPRSTAAATAAATASSRQSGGLFSAPPSLKATGKDVGAGGGRGGSNKNGNAGFKDAAASAVQAATAMNLDPSTLVTPLGLAGGGSTAARSDVRRAWGAWKTNRRIQEAESTLLKAATRAATLPSAEPPLPAPPRAAPSAPPATAAGNGDGGGSSGGPGADSEVVVVLSKRVGSNRPPKVVEAPEARQDRVKEALRVFSEMGNDVGDDDEEDEQLFGRSASLLAGGRKPWWQQRFQALFLPSIGYPDGSMGFLQVNVSLSGDRRDMRVLAFEDRSDCTACLTLMAQWPEHEGTEPRMSMMPTEKLLQQLQDIYDEQPDVNSGVSRPRGLAVFRRAKLPMRPGMGPEEFIQAVVYQHAAQVALARTGYGFNA
ncbi:hypothetical protein VaNZ11_016307 [Volvox africanus]|uniref:Uncharacterized protein n=1 Tax=Volvox africanus TaxID=51714 RepID=A0ABQ5SMH7_9CHLO|nr:hypothetical protein VaNZ11_016307 [Volvox africanus]